MSEDSPGQDGAGGDGGEWEATGEPTTGSTPQVEEPVPHSRLVGLMAVPISRSVPIRRSTALMLVAFVGFGTLCYLFPPSGSSTSDSTATTNAGVPGFFVPSASTTTTTHPVTTTSTTRPPGTTTTSTTSTTRPTGTTTTTRATGTTTTTHPGVTPTTSTTSPLGATTTTAPGATTSTTAAP